MSKLRYPGMRTDCFQCEEVGGLYCKRCLEEALAQARAEALAAAGDAFKVEQIGSEIRVSVNGMVIPWAGFSLADHDARVRAEALEEAAMLADGAHNLAYISTAIRALKDKP